MYIYEIVYILIFIIDFRTFYPRAETNLENDVGYSY